MDQKNWTKIRELSLEIMDEAIADSLDIDLEKHGLHYTGPFLPVVVEALFKARWDVKMLAIRRGLEGVTWHRNK